MAGVLLILRGTRDCRGVVDRAIEKAATEHDRLVVLSVLDAAVLQKTSSRMTEHGHVGTTPTRGLAESVCARREDLIRAESSEAVSRGEAASVETRSIVRRGDFVREATEVIKEERPRCVMISKRPRSILRMRSADAFLDGLAAEVGFDLVEV